MISMSSCSHRGLKAVTLACGLLAVAAPVAAASGGFSIGSPQLAGGRATSNQDVNRDGTRDVKCSSGTYLFAISAYGATWGTYPAVEAVGLWCKSPSGSEASPVSFGTVAAGFPSLPSLGSGRCTGTNGALTGLNVNADRFIKDIKARCGEIFAGSGQKTRVDDDGYQDSWMLDQVQNNDTQEGLRCGKRKVVTGLRIRYREDSNETAFTSLQLFCSTVSKA